MLLSFANIFLGSSLIYNFELYAGFFVLCGFVVFDTQMIVEKNRMGSKDFISDALCLFVDFITLFRRLVIILTQKVNNFNWLNMTFFLKQKMSNKFVMWIFGFFFPGTTEQEAQ